MKGTYRSIAFLCALALVCLYAIFLPKIGPTPKLGPKSVDPFLLLLLLFMTPLLVSLGIGFTTAGHRHGESLETSVIALTIFYSGFILAITSRLPAILSRLSMHNYL